MPVDNQVHLVTKDQPEHPVNLVKLELQVLQVQAVFLVPRVQLEL